MVKRFRVSLFAVVLTLLVVPLLLLNLLSWGLQKRKNGQRGQLPPE